MIPQLGATELLIIGLILVLLFGAKKLPDTARALGRSLRIFKSETKALRDDDEETVVTAEREKPAQQPQPLPPGGHTAQPTADSSADAEPTVSGVPLSDYERNQNR